MSGRAAAASLAVAVAALVGATLYDVSRDAESSTDALPAAQERALEALVADPRVGPGAVAVVSTPAGTRSGAAGHAELESKEPMRPELRFRVASITKTYVAAAVLQLVADGELGLDDTLGERLPGRFPADKRRITVRQLLRHQSGLEDTLSTAPSAYVEAPGAFLATIRDPALRRRVRSAAAELRRDPATVLPKTFWTDLAAARPLVFRPGSQRGYSNTNYAVLGEVVERTTGKSLGAVLRERLFRPLGLTDTFYVPGRELPRPFAHAYEHDGERLVETTLVTMGISGASSVVADADDVARFYGALLRGDVLPPRLLETMLREELGIWWLPLRCGDTFGHDGGWAGYASWARASEDGSKVAVLFVNGRGPETGTAGQDAIDALFCGTK
jgi:D-alanyl-D-alanine carboxypeptidase